MEKEKAMKAPFHLDSFVDGFASGQVGRIVTEVRGMHAAEEEEKAALLAVACECLRRVNELGKGGKSDGAQK